MSKPFAGVRILDFTRYLAGPYGTYQLALLGADVIKIESQEGDETRISPADRTWAERKMAPSFLSMNGNKRSITLDLRRPEAIEVVERLVVGEYDNAGGTRRLGHVALGGGPMEVHEAGVQRAQGVVRVGERWYVTASHGPWKPGSIWSGRAGNLREHRCAVPMGCEDLAHDPATDLLWTVTEHPHRRWIVAVRRSRVA